MSLSNYLILNISPQLNNSSMTTWTQQSPQSPDWDQKRPSITNSSTPVGLLLVLTRFVGSAIDTSHPFTQASPLSVSFTKQSPVSVSFTQQSPQSVDWEEKEAA